MRLLFALLLVTACKKQQSSDVTTETLPLTSTTEPTETTPTEPTLTTPTSPTTGPVEPLVRRHDCGGIEPADAAPLNGYVALTFDDGPDGVDTPDILGTLRFHNVPATFFAVGVNLSNENYWPIVEDIVDDPLFMVANHSWTHANLPTLSMSGIEAEIDDTTAMLETFTAPKYFRFPYGSSTCELHDMVTDRGYRVVGWHIDTGDWCYAATGDVGVCTQEDYWRIPLEYEADMIGWTMEQVRRYDGGIILLHDIHAWTASMLDTLIVELQSEGYVFTSLDDATAFPKLAAGEYADFPYLGEACSVSVDRCWESEFFSYCEAANGGDDGICTLSCDGTCSDRDGAATTFCATSQGAGQCVARAHDLNEQCALTPGTSAVAIDRFIGDSSSSPLTTEVCWPDAW